MKVGIGKPRLPQRRHVVVRKLDPPVHREYVIRVYLYATRESSPRDAFDFFLVLDADLRPKKLVRRVAIELPFALRGVWRIFLENAQ